MEALNIEYPSSNRGVITWKIAQAHFECTARELSRLEYKIGPEMSMEEYWQKHQRIIESMRTLKGRAMDAIEK